MNELLNHVGLVILVISYVTSVIAVALTKDGSIMIVPGGLTILWGLYHAFK